MEDNYFKGRGAQIKSENRFLKSHYVTDHIDGLDEPLLENPQTQVFQENAKKNCESRREPFKGIDKPETLRGNLSGYWSRRITGEHRLVYRVYGSKPNQTLVSVKVRFHY